MTDGNTKTLLVITAHPADAFDLAAGTIALHRQRGDQVHVASVTHGARSHAPSIYDDKQEALDEAREAQLLQEIIQEKKQEFEAAARAVDATATHFLGEDDEPFVATRRVILRLAELYRTVRPDILITHHRTEQNHHDHPEVGDASARALVTAARWLEGSRLEPYDVPTVYYYGTQDRRDVRINRGTVGVAASHVVDIESVVDQKREALKAFATQKYQGKGYSTPEYLNRRLESVEGHYGLFSGCRYAEEFIARGPHVTRLLPSVR